MARRLLNGFALGSGEGREVRSLADADKPVEKSWADYGPSDLPPMTREHVRALEADVDDPQWFMADMPNLILRTIGRKSGNEHKVALCFWRDGEGVPVIVASFAGSPTHPAWYLNLADRTANPEVLVRIQRDSYWSKPEVLLEGGGYDRLWSQLLEYRPWYLEYTAKTSRRFPLIRLLETRSA
jgi:F420H(2)-dependent quinone reductase